MVGQTPCRDDDECVRESHQGTTSARNQKGKGKGKGKKGKGDKGGEDGRTEACSCLAYGILSAENCEPPAINQKGKGGKDAGKGKGKGEKGAGRGKGKEKEHVFLSPHQLVKVSPKGVGKAMKMGLPIGGDSAETVNACRERIFTLCELPSLEEVRVKHEHTEQEMACAYVGTTVLLLDSFDTAVIAEATFSEGPPRMTLMDGSVVCASRLCPWPHQPSHVKVECTDTTPLPNGFLTNYAASHLGQICGDASGKDLELGGLYLSATKPSQLKNALTLHATEGRTLPCLYLEASCDIARHANLTESDCERVCLQLGVHKAQTLFIPCAEKVNKQKCKGILALLGRDPLAGKRIPSHVVIRAGDEGTDTEEAPPEKKVSVTQIPALRVKFSVDSGRAEGVLLSKDGHVVTARMGHNPNVSVISKVLKEQLHVRTKTTTCRHHRQSEVFDGPPCEQCNHSHDLSDLTKQEVNTAVERTALLPKGTYRTWKDLQDSVAEEVPRLLQRAEDMQEAMRLRSRQLKADITHLETMGDNTATLTPLRAEEEDMMTQRESFREKRKSLLAETLWGSCRLSSVRVLEREVRRLGALLPILTHRKAVVDFLTKQQHGVLLVDASTGSGKSTQLIQYASEAVGGDVWCCQPRDLARASLQRRVNEEMGYADQCKSSLRFLNTKSLLDKVLAIKMSDERAMKEFRHVRTIIVDEVHERSLWTDILLPLLRELLDKKAREGKSLHIILASATMDTQFFEDYFNRGNAPVERLTITGRAYPVVVQYGASHVSLTSYLELAHSKVREVVEAMPEPTSEEHILVFVPRRQDVEALVGRLEELVEDYPVLPMGLYGGMDRDEQMRVFNKCEDKIKIVVSTNIAETSVTINGVKVVIDTGVVNQDTYSAAKGISVTRLSPISRSSAEQRKGRAGRTCAGVCYRLFSEEAFHSMEPDIVPEIFRVDPMEAVLKLKQANVDVHTFDFISSLPDGEMETATRKLAYLGLLTQRGGITADGREVIQSGKPPRLGRFQQLCAQNGLAAAGSLVQDALSLGADAFFKKQTLTVQKSPLEDLMGDIGTVMCMMRLYAAEQQAKRKRFCTEMGLNFKQMRGAPVSVDLSAAEAEKVGRLLKKHLVAVFFDHLVWDLGGGKNLFSPSRNSHGSVGRHSAYELRGDSVLLSFDVKEYNHYLFLDMNVPVAQGDIDAAIPPSSAYHAEHQNNIKKVHAKPHVTRCDFSDRPAIFKKMFDASKGEAGWAADVERWGGKLVFDLAGRWFQVVRNAGQHEQIRELLEKEERTAALCLKGDVHEVPVSEGSATRLLVGDGYNATRFLASNETITVEYECECATRQRDVSPHEAQSVLKHNFEHLITKAREEFISPSNPTGAIIRTGFASLVHLEAEAMLSGCDVNSPAYKANEPVLRFAEEFVLKYRSGKKSEGVVYIECRDTRGAAALTWGCPACTYINKKRDSKCEMCETPQSAAQQNARKDHTHSPAPFQLGEQGLVRAVSKIPPRGMWYVLRLAEWGTGCVQKKNHTALLSAKQYVRVVASEAGAGGGALFRITPAVQPDFSSDTLEGSELPSAFRRSLYQTHNVCGMTMFRTTSGLAGKLYFKSPHAAEVFVRSDVVFRGKDVVKSLVTPGGESTRCMMKVRWKKKPNSELDHERRIVLGIALEGQNVLTTKHTVYFVRRTNEFCEEIEFEDCYEAERHCRRVNTGGSYEMVGPLKAVVKMNVDIPIRLPYGKARRIADALQKLIQANTSPPCAADLRLSLAGCFVKVASSDMQSLRTTSAAISNSLRELKKASPHINVTRETETFEEEREMKLRLMSPHADRLIRRLEKQYPKCFILRKSSGHSVFICGEGAHKIHQQVLRLAKDAATPTELTYFVPKRLAVKAEAVAKQHSCKIGKCVTGTAVDVLAFEAAMKRDKRTNAGPEEKCCQICMEETVEGGRYEVSACRHVFHKDCLADSLRHVLHLTTDNPFPLKCPVCPPGATPLLMHDVFEMLNVTGVDKNDLTRALVNQILRTDGRQLEGKPQVSACIVPDCAGIHVSSRSSSGMPVFASCTECGTRVCTNCKNPKHDDVHEACADFAARNAHQTEAERLTAAAMDAMRKCPNCKRVLEKHSGCNAMLCSMCDTAFCWLCDKICGKDAHGHFSIKGTKCYGKCFAGLY